MSAKPSSVRVGTITTMREVGSIAGECPACGCYHVNAESVLVEILCEDGEPCAPGETGRVSQSGKFEDFLSLVPRLRS